ncbi:MAG: hypothetical protein ACK56F_31515, partial [bacterium]
GRARERQMRAVSSRWNGSWGRTNCGAPGSAPRGRLARGGVRPRRSPLGLRLRDWRSALSGPIPPAPAKP